MLIASSRIFESLKIWGFNVHSSNISSERLVNDWVIVVYKILLSDEINPLRL